MNELLYEHPAINKRHRGQNLVLDWHPLLQLLESATMKRIAIMLLCPYLAPFMILAVVVIVFLALAPPDVYDGTRPPGRGNDMMGAFFLISCSITGVAAQVLLGIPVCLLLMKIRTRFWRIMLSVDAALIPVVLFGVMVHDMPFRNETIISALLVAVLFGLGAWLPFRVIHPSTDQEFVP